MKLTSFTLIEYEDHFLLVCDHSLKWKNHWFFPGANSENIESPEQSIINEVKEEIGCELHLKGMFYTKYNPGIITAELCFYYYAKPISSIDIRNMHSSKYRWFTYEEVLKLPLKENAIDIIDTYRNLKKRKSIHEYA